MARLDSGQTCIDWSINKIYLEPITKVFWLHFCDSHKPRFSKFVTLELKQQRSIKNYFITV